MNQCFICNVPKQVFKWRRANQSDFKRQFIFVGDSRRSKQYIVNQDKQQQAPPKPAAVHVQPTTAKPVTSTFKAIFNEERISASTYRPSVNYKPTTPPQVFFDERATKSYKPETKSNDFSNVQKSANGQ